MKTRRERASPEASILAVSEKVDLNKCPERMRLHKERMSAKSSRKCLHKEYPSKQMAVAQKTGTKMACPGKWKH